MSKILLADDEKGLVTMMKHYFELSGYQVLTACCGAEALKQAARQPDIILLDINMPDIDGLTVCQRIREHISCPILFLTARVETSDTIRGFQAGADDYITKPFNILELKARIRALIRRSSMAPAAPAEPDSGKLVRGHIEIDPERRSAHRFGQNVELTLKEFDLIELLMRNPGKVYSREQLLDLVWGYDYQGDIRTVDVHIRRLREKLERNPAAPEYIITKWGVGYYFAEA